MELFKASQQWSTRPDDERFWTVEDMARACMSYARNAREANVPFRSLEPVVVGNDLLIAGPTGKNAGLTNYAFKQLCARAGAPASYLAELPAHLAASNLKHGLNKNDSTAQLLIHPRNGAEDDMIIRAATTDRYERFWNFEVCARLLDLKGWRVPPARPVSGASANQRPATEADVLSIGGGGGLSVRVGDMIAPAGLYASDHDMFAFLINENRIDDGTEGGLSRGIMIANSEVGDSSLWIMGFRFRHVCGNHIVWGASDVFQVRVAHKGQTMRNTIDREFVGSIVKYANESSKEDEARILSSKSFALGKSKDDVLDLIFGKKILSRKQAEKAYSIAESHPEDGDPRSAWGFANGVTRLSQATSFADIRVQMDKAAGRVLEMAF